ncbi:MAG TPA: phosphatase PAP2 family protein [Gaiellaceae bacterium]|nr:phosphatase PAP2 family protein [Gaiellaceae bacterium]
MLAAILGAVGFRLLGTRTGFGREFDIEAVLSGFFFNDKERSASNAFLVAISSTSFVVIGGLLVAMSLVQRRLDLALAAALTLGGSFVTTELLKKTLPARANVPDFLAHSYPSGHSTVALALGLSFILLSPRRVRTAAVVGATICAAAMGASLVLNAWHFPSDVGGGFCVATAWAAAAAQLVRRPAERGVPGILLAAAAVVVVAAALGAIHLRPGLSFDVHAHGRLFDAALGIVLVAAACCAAYAYAIAARSAAATRS